MEPDEPKKHRVVIRDDPDGELFATWHTGTGMSCFLRIYTNDGERERIAALDKVELKQTARALRGVLDDEKEALVRDIGIERLWFESDRAYVALWKRSVGGPKEMTLLTEAEARRLLEAVKDAIETYDAVEDAPHV